MNEQSIPQTVRRDLAMMEALLVEGDRDTDIDTLDMLSNRMFRTAEKYGGLARRLRDERAKEREVAHEQ